MGLWFFLSVAVVCHLAFKAYKLRVYAQTNRSSNEVLKLEREIETMREKIQHLEEAVFFGDFELKQQFKDLEQEMSPNKRRS